MLTCPITNTQDLEYVLGPIAFFPTEDLIYIGKSKGTAWLELSSMVK